MLVVDPPGSAPSAEQPRPPLWSLTGMLLRWPDRNTATIVQAPFRWADSAWEARVYVTRSAVRPRTLVLRLAPDTHSRWRDLTLNSTNEAARQLQQFIDDAGWHEPDLGTLALS
jgi:hypothetical protein